MFPGLAVAEQIARRGGGVRITFVGSGRRFERRHVAAAGFDYVSLPCRGVPRKIWQLPDFLIQNAAGYLAARRFVKNKAVSLVVALGGYVSVPMARAAGANKAKLVLLEQNTVPGRANRWLAPRADAVCVAFEETAARLPKKCRVHVTGTPIRESRAAADGSIDTVFKFIDSANINRRLAVLGGSAGAASINENMPRALYKIRDRLDGWQIIHQAGESRLDATRVLYQKLGVKADVQPFIADVPELLHRSGLAVCRAGGSTLAEVAAAGVPAVLLPYPYAVDDHQRKNAELFQRSGGCVMVDEREVEGRLDDRLAQSLGELLGDDLRRARISQTVSRLGRPDAARRAADLIEEMLDA